MKPVLFLILLFVFNTSPLTANQEDYNKGKDLADKLAKEDPIEKRVGKNNFADVPDLPLKENDSSDAPEFDEEKVAETNFYSNSQGIEESAQNLSFGAKTEDKDPRKQAAAVIRESERLKPKFDMEHEAGLLLKAADKIHEKGLENIGVTTVAEAAPSTGIESETRHTCEEPGEPYPEVCYRTYTPKFKTVSTPRSERVSINLYKDFLSYEAKSYSQRANSTVLTYLIYRSLMNRRGGHQKLDNGGTVIFEMSFIPQFDFPQDIVKKFALTSLSQFRTDLKTKYGTNYETGQKALLKDVANSSSTNPALGSIISDYPLSIAEPWNKRDHLTGKPTNINFNTLERMTFIRMHGPYQKICTNTGGWWTDYEYAEIKFEWLDEKKVAEEGWTYSCGELEEKVDKGICEYVTKECVEGPGTRIIDGVEVYAPCWKEKFTYSCKFPSKDTCKQWRAKGCEQVHSTCKERVGKVCVNYLQTFKCVQKKHTNGTVTMGGKIPFCLDGNCDDHSWTANGDFAEAMSKLAIFKEMAKDFQVEPIGVFKGAGNSCKREVLSFRDCCASGGWGVKLGLSSCSAEEKALQQKRAENKCVYVGTFCSQREAITRICLTKKSVYCCFESKLSRMIHEQGRKQLNIGWGTAENPQCRAFTMEEMSRIDFHQLDMTDLYKDLMASVKSQDFTRITTDFKTEFQTKIPNLKKERYTTIETGGKVDSLEHQKKKRLENQCQKSNPDIKDGGGTNDVIM